MEINTTERFEWRQRRYTSILIRAATIILPVMLAIAVSMLLGRVLPAFNGQLQSFARLVVILGLTTLVMLWSSKQMQRLLPLAVMLKLSWAFPDDVPSRFSVALRHARYKTKPTGVIDTAAHGSVTDHLLDLIRQLNLHHRGTRGHSERVRAYADLLGEELKLSPDERDKLSWSALLHDIGKIEVPVEILDFPGKPDKQQWSVLSKHPEHGKGLVQPVTAWLGEWANGIWEHHERWDGSGYPSHKAKEQISLSGRIIAVADAFETMTAVRAYKKPVSVEVARQEVVSCAGSHFDPNVVRAFLNIGLGHLSGVRGVAAVVQAPLVLLAQAGGVVRSALRVAVGGGAAAMVMAVSAAAASENVTTPAVAPATTVTIAVSTTNVAAVAGPRQAPKADPPAAVDTSTTSSTTTTSAPSIPPPPTRPVTLSAPPTPITETTTTATPAPTMTVESVITTAAATTDPPIANTAMTTTPATLATAPTATTLANSPTTTTTVAAAPTTTTTTTLAVTATTTTTLATVPTHAANDAFTVPAGVYTVINPLANDTGQFDPTSVAVTVRPSGVNVTEHNDGTISVRPAPGHAGSTKVLTYRVCTPSNACSQATITLTVPL